MIGAATPTPSLDEAHAHCRAVVAARAKNFSYAFLLLPPARRRGLEAIYAYCRVADDLADDDGLTTEERARRLADLRARLRRALPRPGEAPPPAPAADDPALDLLMTALADTAGRYGVSRDDLDLVAQGCEQDLTVTRYETWDDLRGYCYLVASAVGLACLPVFGLRGDLEAARPFAEDLGLAMQLTNIIRDVQEDLARDRVYLPQAELRRFGVTEEALREGRVDGTWRAFCAFQVARARLLFRSGARLAPLVRRRSRVCPLALAALYDAVLDEVERAGYDVFSRRVSLGPARKLGLLGLSFGRGLVTRADPA
ncbi:MAG: phytoene/squalene synthase family protein [Planctomycetes bacterium]|nr:phytoene/squalene synthase family protein [Planctomycetota bacterium]